MKKLVLLLISSLLVADMGTVEKVVDGATIYFRIDDKKAKCRIAFIDVPDKNPNERAKRMTKTCQDVSLYDITRAGHEATWYAKQLLKPGKRYRVFIAGIDPYNRDICVVLLPNGETYNERMVKDGYAVPYRRYIPYAMKQRYETLYDGARRHRNGLWKIYRHVMECLMRQ